MNDLTVNVHDYLTDEQIAEVCKEEIQRQIRMQFANNPEGTNTRLISNISYMEVFDEISETIGADARQMLKDAIKRILGNDSSIKYELFKRKDDFYHRNSPAIDMMDEIVAENRGLMEKKVREAIEDFDFSDVQDEIYEVAQEVIYKRIFEKEDKNNVDA